MIQDQEIKQLLNGEMQEQFIENLKENEINWIDDGYWDSWDRVKGYSKKLWGHKQEYNEDKEWKRFFLCHSQDSIQGKPLLINNCKVRLPLIRQAVKKSEIEIRDKDGNPIKDDKGKVKTKNGNIQSFYFLGEKFDKRHDGFQKDAFALDFYKYRVETPDDKEIYVFTEKKLPTETSIFKGMLVELDDYSEMSRTMKIPSLSRIFFVKEAEPFVKALSEEDLVNMVKEKGIKEIDWLNHLARHPFGTFNNFPMESEMLHSSHILSGKFDGYPLHVKWVGPQGSRKTMGKGETTEFKFSDQKFMVDSGNSRLKGLGASYKGTIVEPGYLAKQDRIAIVDEIGKMIEAEIMKSGGTNILGELNAILEHKERKVVSGNTGESSMKPTAKILMLTNPVGSRKNISSHVGLIDPTYMSRCVWWVQDSNELKFVLGENGILRTPKESSKTIIHTEPPQKTEASIYNWDMVIENRKDILLKKSFGVDIDRNTFLTIFDSCYSFLSDLDHEKIQKLADMTSNLSQEPMRSVWKPRAFHHIALIVDGLCKHRCLFKDYDPSFTAKPEDYAMAERILVRMVKGWDTDLSPKQEVQSWR